MRRAWALKAGCAGQFADLIDCPVFPAVEHVSAVDVRRFGGIGRRCLDLPAACPDVGMLPAKAVAETDRAGH